MDVFRNQKREPAFGPSFQQHIPPFATQVRVALHTHAHAHKHARDYKEGRVSWTDPKERNAQLTCFAIVSISSRSTPSNARHKKVEACERERIDHVLLCSVQRVRERNQRIGP